MDIQYCGALELGRVHKIVASGEFVLGSPITVLGSQPITRLKELLASPNVYLISGISGKEPRSSTSFSYLIAEGSKCALSGPQKPVWRTVPAALQQLGEVGVLYDTDKASPLLLAFAYKNLIILNCRVFEKANPGAYTALRYILHTVGPLLSTVDAPLPAQVDLSALAGVITEIVTASFKSEGKLLKNDIERLEFQRSEYDTTLNNIITELASKRQVLKSLDATTTADGILEEQVARLAALVKAGDIVQITATDVGLRAVTREIFVDNVALGRYIIVINPSGKYTISSETNRIIDGCIHPHVPDNGRPCWGNMASAAAELEKSADIAGMLELLVRFLGSYYDSGAYVGLRRFA
jgi:hypothetical protein